jgi:CheY-like chemotaxis protein
MELHPWEAVFNNVLGTQMLLDLCINNGVEKCVIISSDKAVRPTNVMGATKRVTELIAQAYARDNRYKFMAVRFGNVIGSAGSVVPLFRQQIARGGPVTVTHKDVTRYFMTIPEACRLVLQAGAIGHGGEVFVLKMGEPIRIDSLARDMITLSGFTPDKDIPIEYVGLRPGEKLYEELITSGEDVIPTTHEKIMVLASNKETSMTKLTAEIRTLMKSAERFDVESIKGQLCRMVDEYVPDLRPSPPAVPLIPAFASGTAIQIPVNGNNGDHEHTDPFAVRPRVLVIDDEKQVAEVIAVYLNQNEYAASAVFSGKQGIAALETGRYDLVISDVELPDMTGGELLDIIKERHKEVAVVMMTGYATLKPATEVIKKGVEDFITKPFTQPDLKAILDRILGREKKGGVRDIVIDASAV